MRSGVMTNRLAWTKFERGDLIFLRLVLCFTATTRGLNWIDPQEAVFLDTLVDGPIPREFWGMALLVGAFILALGSILQRHFWVWLGHGLLMIIYAAVIVAIIGYALTEPIDDFVLYLRYIGIFAILAAIHVIFWLRTGASPPPPEDQNHA
jgi:hypothetical protein